MRMLVALLEYAAARDFDLPPPALEGVLPCKPRPRPQQELLPSLDPMADLAGPAVRDPLDVHQCEHIAKNLIL